MKAICLRRFFVVIFIITVFVFSSLAQGIMKNVLDGIDFTTLPHREAKFEPYMYCYGVDNSLGKISNKLYENLQCTEYIFADNDDTAPAAYAKFQIPQQETILIAVNFGGATDYVTDVLVAVDDEGNILDTLECTVAQPFVYIKQYRILADGQIVVTSIKPKQEASIPFVKFSPFVGNRIDCTYIVDNGKFVIEKVQRYADNTYTYELLSDKYYNLWDGNEQLLNE